MGKSNTGKIILIIILVLVLILGGLGAFFIASNMGLFGGKGGNGSSNTTELSGTPKSEYVGTYDSIYGRSNKIGKSSSENGYGMVIWGKFYDSNDYKLYFQEKDVLAYTDSSYNTTGCYAEDIYEYNKKTVQEPYNDKNIMFIKTDEDYNIELKDTGDVNLAFLSLDNSKLICISKSSVRAFDVQNGSEIWKINADNNMYFGSIDETISTDRKKLIVNMYTQEGENYKYSISKVINLNEGTEKVIKYSGKVQLKGQNIEKNFENQSIDATAYICEDIYLCETSPDNSTSSVTKIFYIVDDNGNIKSSVSGPVYATASGMLIKPTSQDSTGKIKWTIFNSKLSEINSFKVEKYSNYLNHKGRLPGHYDRNTQTIMAGDKVYSFITPSKEEEYFAFDSEGNILAGFNMDNFSYNSYMFNDYQIVTENEGEEHNYSKDINCIMNIYTGETLKGYEFESKGDGHKQSQGDIAYVKNTEDRKKYFIDAKFNKLCNIPDNQMVFAWANYENSKYMAYSTYSNGNYQIYAINKETKEIIKVKDDSDSIVTRDSDGLLINGEFIMYIIKNGQKDELHAYNIEKKEDSTIFITKSDGDQICFNYRDVRQNNWFYVYREEDKKLDLYRLK